MTQESTGQGPSPGQRAIALRSIGYLLDITSFNRNAQDLLNGLLLSTIVQANVARIALDRDLALAYGTPDTVPPDEMRRPISVHAVSTSLQLPFETVRRRIAALARAGLCRTVPGGVIVPAEAANTADYRRNSLAAYERTRGFYFELLALGALGEGLADTPWTGGQALPTRAVARLTTEYLLRTIEVVMSRFGDFLGGLILLEIVRSNTEDLPPSVILSPEPYVRDELRRPISVRRLAQRLGVPQETTRRHVLRLEQGGFCLGVKGGFIVPATVIATDIVTQAVAGNIGNLHRLFGGLAQLGVIARWEAEAASSGGEIVGGLQAG